MVASIVWLALLGWGQVTPSKLGNHTFAASDGAFNFSYPRGLQVCTSGKISPCIQTYIPVCDGDALVCVVYPSEPLKDTSFGAAAFQVREISRTERMTPDVCLTPYPREDGGWPEFLVSAKHPLELIGTTRFLHGEKGEAALGHSKSTDVYRGFHKGRCFELSVSETGTDPYVSDPPLKVLTAAQRNKLDDTMSRILHGFRFSN